MRGTGNCRPGGLGGVFPRTRVKPDWLFVTSELGGGSGFDGAHSGASLRGRSAMPSSMLCRGGIQLRARCFAVSSASYRVARGSCVCERQGN